MWTIVYYIDITLINVNKAGDFIAFWSCLQIFWSAYTPKNTIVHIYIFFYYIKFYIIFTFYIFLIPSKKMLWMLWNTYTFQNIFEKKMYVFFTWNLLKDILISRIIQVNVWFKYGKTRTIFINANQYVPHENQRAKS